MKRIDRNISSQFENLTEDYDFFLFLLTDFRKNILKNELSSQTITLSLDVYSALPGVTSASLFILDEESFEFKLSNSTSGKEDLTQSKFDNIVEKGIVAKALDEGDLIYQKQEDHSQIILLPLLSFSGVMGLVLILSETDEYNYDKTILNYCLLHSNQIAAILFNSKIVKELNNTRFELEQRISIRTEAIKQSRRELQLILNSILTGVFLIERNSGKIIDTNLIAQQILSYDKNTIVGSKRKQWDPVKLEYNYNFELSTNNSIEESAVITRQGKEVPILRTFSKLVIGNDDIILESFIDISDRKKTEIELQKQRELLSGVADATNTLLTESSFENSIKEAIAFLGKASIVNSVSIYKNHKPDRSNEWFAIKTYEWNINNEQSEFDIEKLSYSKDLTDWYEKLSAKEVIAGLIKNDPENIKAIVSRKGTKSYLVVPIHVNNEFWGFIWFDERESERKWSKEEHAIIIATANSIGGAIQREISKIQLIESKEKAEKADEADKLKSEFLAKMSHEIRTPINTIMNFTSILKDEIKDDNSEDTNEIFNSIFNSGDRIIRTVDLILNMSEIQTGSYKYSPKKLDLYNDIILKTYQEFKWFAKEKSLELFITNKSNDTVLNGDSYTLGKTFENIVDNAIKYTEEGQVEIIISDKSQNELEVSVKDTGIGISEVFLPNIFKPFSQEQDGYTRKFDGNGLGLALANEYCRLNNAKLNIQSKKGVGSTFSVIIPKNL